MKNFLADANFFLRFLLNDVPSQVKKTEKYLNLAKKGEILIFVPQIIIFEIVFVLSKTYRFSKGKVAKNLKSFLVAPYLNIESRKIFLETIETWQQINIDFVDIFLAVLAQKTNFQILTFDKKLKKLYPFLCHSDP